MTPRSLRAVTAFLVGLCAFRNEPLAGQPGTPAVSQLGCLDRTAIEPSRVTTCTQMMTLGHLHTPSLPSTAEGSARAAGGAGKGALIGLGVGLAAGGLSAALLASGCEENESQCTVTLIVGGAALGAGVGALIGAISGPNADTTASRTHATVGGGFLNSGDYFTGPSAIQLTTGDAFAATAQVSMEIHPSWAVVFAGSYASPEWQLPGVPPPGSLSLTGASLWFVDAALRGQLRLGAPSPKVPMVFVQAGPGLGFYSVSVTLNDQVYDDDAVNLAAALAGGLTLPLSRRFGIEVMAKDYIVSFDPPDASFGLEGRTAHTPLLLAGARLGL